MYYFIKKKDTENRFDVTDISFKVDTESRDELIEEFASFLKACGFHLKGSLDVIEDEDDNDI